MSRTLQLGFVLSFAAIGGACVVQATDGSGGKKGTGGAVSTTESLPCDVSDVVNASCTSCHSDPPQNGAPTPLLTYSDFTAPSKTNPAVSMAEASLARMQDATSPMPPGGAPADQIAIMQKWIDAGMPQGSCDTTNPPPDPAFTSPLTCSSGKTWPVNSTGSRMYPGVSCNKCHNFSGPAGTVYPTGHEPDRCYGINGNQMSDVIVRITGSDGKVQNLHPSDTGNFRGTSVKKPYTATVISSAGERPMLTPQTDVDCNKCHSAMGNGAGSTAPGRIVIPL